MVHFVYSFFLWLCMSLNLPNTNQNGIIVDALCSGNVETLKKLNVYEVDDEQRFRAIFIGFQHVHLVEYMLEQRWPVLLENGDFWVLKAVKSHPPVVIEKLCQLIDAPLDEALVAAVRSNRPDLISVLNILLPHCDPKFSNSKALQWASINRNCEVFDLLYPLSDPQVALDMLQQISHNSVDTMMLNERIDAERIKKILDNQLGNKGIARERKM